MLKITQRKIGRLSSIIYEFEVAGDVLPMHTHGEHDVHITIINKGRFKITTDTYEKEVVPGQIMDWRVGEPHEIASLEDDARLVNIIKNIQD
jgi:quercetin dioxygenase-like cupin family protein